MKQIIKFFLVLISLINFISANDKILRNECFYRNESRTSCNGCFKLHFSSNVDFVVENVNSKVIVWSAGIKSDDAHKACMQEGKKNSKNS